jgi:MerR family transcriptional regulator/heat shock protein HspR
MTMAKRPKRPGRQSDPDPAQDRAVYIISVAAELAGVHPQTLRIYERKGLLRPARTAGNTRRYSNRDIERLRLIQQMTQDQGINLAGVKMIVEMENELERMRLRVQVLHREVERARKQMREELERAARQSHRAEIVPLATIQRLRRLTAAPEATAGRDR